MTNQIWPWKFDHMVYTLLISISDSCIVNERQIVCFVSVMNKFILCV